MHLHAFIASAFIQGSTFLCPSKCANTPKSLKSQARTNRRLKRYAPLHCNSSVPIMTSASDDSSRNSSSDNVTSSRFMPVEDRYVPSAHRGLHEVLYGNNAETVHGSGTSERGLQKGPRFSDDVGKRLFSINDFFSAVGKEKVAGVYRILNASSHVVYIGMSRDVVLNVRSLYQTHGNAMVAFIRLQTFQFPRRSDMEMLRDKWLAEYRNGNGETPIGNTEPQWNDRPSTMLAMTEEQRTQFEDTKFKLRKAMADPTLQDDIDMENKERSEHLRRALEHDDWSAEIDRQTQSTQARTSKIAPMISPFARASAPTSGLNLGSEAQAAEILSPLELTSANVDKVLESVRPYLLSDGGNVSVVSVDSGTGKVLLQLEGACGTCASASTTMRLGIERALQEAFGTALKELSAISEANAREAPLSIAVVDKILDDIRPTITGLGGCVRVVSAMENTVRIDYKGPDKLAYGIELMLRERLPRVHVVEFEK